MQVASPQAWEMNRSLVIRFYNERRKQLIAAKPNKAHRLIAGLEKDFDFEIITRNIDDLHERSGSSKVVHLHGELHKSRSTIDPSLIYNIDSWELNQGDLCEMGSQLRPHMVWFGEPVEEMSRAAQIASTADIFLVIGTSLNLYTAAGLVHYAPESAEIYLIDPNDTAPISRNVHFIREKATTGMEEFRRLISA